MPAIKAAQTPIARVRNLRTLTSRPVDLDDLVGLTNRTELSSMP
jgi:hypothetical protein